MKRICKAVALVAAVTTSVTMGGCTTSDYGNKQLGGTLLGAGAGGLVGAQFGSGTGKLRAINVSGAILSDASDGALLTAGSYGNEIAQEIDGLLGLKQAAA